MASVLRGAPAEYAMRAAMCDVSPTFRIELIEPLDDRSPYAQSLERHGGADHLHHVRFDVEDYGGARGDLERLGSDVVLDATFAGAEGATSEVQATYFATERELGFLLELADVPPGFSMPPPERTYP
jgi:hypothetical protein